MTADVPDHWPPAPGTDAPTGPVVPLFPLANVWLFPGAVMPLHIFEPRYRQMVEDSLDQTGRVVLGTVCDGHERDMAGAPPIYPIAGLGEIARHERLPDGRFLLLLLGLQRVRVREVPSDRLYRRVALEPFEERPIPECRCEDVQRRLREAVLERTNDLLNLPEDMPASSLCDLLTLRMPLPHAVVRRIYTECDLAERAELALAEHAQRPFLDDGQARRSDPPLDA
jgi:uncharacterized protein